MSIAKEFYKPVKSTYDITYVVPEVGLHAMVILNRNIIITNNVCHVTLHTFRSPRRNVTSQVGFHRICCTPVYTFYPVFISPITRQDSPRLPVELIVWSVSVTGYCHA